jgi:serine/threonine protein kinase
MDAQGSLEAAGEERTVTLPGQKCLRGTPSQNALLALIEKHVDIPDAVNPSLQTMELTDKLLPFYDTTTRPPDHNPYIPTHVDLQELILPILKNGKITTGNKCITILRDVDDWYGSKGYKGYIAHRTASKPENDSALGDMSQSFQTPSLSSNPDSGIFPYEKHPLEQAISTELPAKRLRMDRIAKSNESQAVFQIPIVSPEPTQDFSISSQNRSKDVLQPKNASGLAQRVLCLEEGCITSIKGRQNMKGMATHYAESHFATKVFLCPEPGCYEGFLRRERFFGEDGHFYKQHNYAFNDKKLWADLQSKTVPTAISDIFHDVCPRCEVYVKHQTYQQYAEHRDEHLKGNLTNYPFNHLCSEKTHHWTTSHCIPEEYRRKLEGKKKPAKSCIDPALGSFKDQDSNGGGPPGPFGPGNNGPPHGHQGPPWGANQGGDDADTGYRSNTYAGGYRYQCSSQPSLDQSSFSGLSGKPDSKLHVPIREFSRTSIPGINLIKKCFESVRKLGRGGFGAVDEVRCKSTKKLYARKIIPLSQLKTNFSSEVEILKQLRHQHIINLDAYCITSDQLWLFMTPVAEKDLATYLRGDAICSIRLSEREHMRKWEICLASALKYLHGSGLVHGDIKPQNILISFDMRIYLADFGSSRARYLEAGAGMEAKRPSALTPKYSAPEMFYYQSIGYNWQMGAAADVFSLGCVWAEIETVYTGLSIQVFETFRSGGSAYTSFQANLPMTYAWLDFLWALQESVLQSSRSWTYATSSLQTAKEMLSYDPHQRPSAHRLTDHHCACSIDIPVLRGHEFLHDGHSSAIVGKAHESSACFEIDDASPPSQIIAKLQIKPWSNWEVTTGGFPLSGRIDASYSWDSITPNKWCSTWVAGLATSAAPLFFGGKTRYSEPLPDLPKFHIPEGDQVGDFDAVIGKDFLKVICNKLSLKPR